MNTIVTLTMNPAVDKSARVERVRSNDKLRSTHVRRDAGGGGINVSRVLVRLGSPTRAIYTCGGIEGELLTGLLEEERIDALPIRINGAVRENLTVVEESTGDQYRFGMPGPDVSSAELDAVEVAVRTAVEPGAFFVASGSLPPGVPSDFYARIAGVAADAGALTVVDTSGTALEKAVRAGVFLVKPNLAELAALVGEREIEEPRIREAAGELVRSGRARYVVVSLGSGGALLVTADGSTRIAAPTVAVQSRIGAGDSMVAGMLASLAAGGPIVEAARHGVAAGAAAVMTPGTELCRAEDVKRLFGQMTQR